MNRRPGSHTVVRMFTTFPTAWLLVALPFLSAAVISQVPALRRLAGGPSWVWWMGCAGLAVLISSLLGWLPIAWAPVLIPAGGLVSGFAFFRRPAAQPSLPVDPALQRLRTRSAAPTLPSVPLSIDWERFDRLRQHWESR